MTMMAFHTLFPTEAATECRSVTPVGGGDLPSRMFLLVEAYCTEPGCDCRRVLIEVVDAERREQVATIAYEFDPAAEAAPGRAPRSQASLDSAHPQSSMSTAFLELFETMITRDEDYRERLVRHYTTWRAVVDDPSHPGHRTFRTGRSGSGGGGSTKEPGQN